MTRHGGDEDARAEYAQDDRDLYDAGLRLARLPEGGWVWVRKMNHETKENNND